LLKTGLVRSIVDSITLVVFASASLMVQNYIRINRTLEWEKCILLYFVSLNYLYCSTVKVERSPSKVLANGFPTTPALWGKSCWIGDASKIATPPVTCKFTGVQLLPLPEVSFPNVVAVAALLSAKRQVEAVGAVGAGVCLGLPDAGGGVKCTEAGGR
jgi:hypothetical protein